MSLAHAQFTMLSLSKFGIVSAHCSRDLTCSCSGESASAKLHSWLQLQTLQLQVEAELVNFVITDRKCETRLVVSE